MWVSVLRLRCSQIQADMFTKELGSPTEHSTEVADSVGPLSGFVMEQSLTAKTASGKQMETPQLPEISFSRHI